MRCSKSTYSLAKQVVSLSTLKESTKNKKKYKYNSASKKAVSDDIMKKLHVS